MIFDSQQDKKDFLEMLNRFPAENALHGYRLILKYTPIINAAKVMDADAQRKMISDSQEAKE